jgi:hypothetical protein
MIEWILRFEGGHLESTLGLSLRHAEHGSLRGWASHFGCECVHFELAQLGDRALVDEIFFLADDSVLPVGAAMPGEIAAIDRVVFELAGEVGGGVDAGLRRGRWVLLRRSSRSGFVPSLVIGDLEA